MRNIYRVEFKSTVSSPGTCVQFDRGPRGKGLYHSRVYRGISNTQINRIEAMLRKYGFFEHVCVFCRGIVVTHLAPDSYKRTGPQCEICGEEILEGEGHPQYPSPYDDPLWVHDECYNKVMQEGI